jgi:uncharacterized repeat protein (TIGR02543 family)
MKKLKILLMLGILLCFGFALSSEVHAQGAGPKIFEVGDVLPATTQLKISWDNTFVFTYSFPGLSIRPNDISGFQIIVGDDTDFSEYNFAIYKSTSELYIVIDSVWQSPYSEYGGSGQSYVIIDISHLTEEQRTIHPDSDTITGLYWEDLAPAPQGFNITFEENGGTSVTDLTEQTALPDPLPIPTKSGYTFLGWYYDDDFFTRAFPGDPLTDDVILYARWLPGKLFEVDDVLPATTQLKIRILFGQGDYHVETVDRSGIYLSIDWIDGVKDLYLEIGGNVRYDGEVTSDEIYYTIDTLDWSLDQRTIKSVSSENGTFVTWEDITPDGYTQGYLEAREEFGYYDSRTNEWLSVDEYLDLYGTEKMGQSDFYNNFDKYFIPAMIIVFGGAIVLTVLKVFKGRE